MAVVRLLSRILVTTALAMFVTPQLAQAQQLRPVPDVEGQFDALSYRPDALGFDIGDTVVPTTCKHYEGIARLEGADGTPYFALTRSGLYVPPCFLTDDEPGSLVIVRMGSRDKTGERLRSNRLKKGVETEDTFSDPNCLNPSCLTDVAISFRNFNGAGGWPRMGHPESMQVIGNMLVVGVDTPLTSGNSRSSTLPPMRVLFMNASDPENLQIVNEFVPADMDFPGNREPNGGIISIANRPNGRYLLMITGASRSNFPFDTYNEKMWFFESNSNTKRPDGTIDPDGVTDLSAPGLTWRFLDLWQADGECHLEQLGTTTVCLPNYTDDENYAGQDWPVSKGQEHQMYNFIRQGDVNGTLYLAGARGGIDLVAGLRIGDDMLDLYRVDFIGDQIKLKLVSSKQKDSHPSLQSTVLAEGESNFAAASGFHISPSGEIIFYATAHANYGPSRTPLVGPGIVTVGEWRHHNMVRPDSPTLLPTVKIFPPTGNEFTVNEGDTATLAGLGQQPVSKAWLQLYSDKDFSGRYATIDFLDWSKDDWDDFGNLEGTVFDLHFGFNNEASSARWFTPTGTHIRLNQYPFDDGDYPGGDARLLTGIGKDDDLGGLEDDIMSAEFRDDVAAYYSGSPDVYWDTALNGTFSTSGIIVSFPATELDGPSLVNVGVKAVHPVDGLAGYANAPVRVLNVPPSITQFGIFNNLNQQLGTTVPFFVQGLPVTVRGSFTDPGKPDHQTSVINWGDTISTASNAYVSFSDAFGGATGQLSDTRTYAGAGNFNLVLNVTDDDGGATAVSMIVPVLTQEQALAQMIQTLDQIIAATTDARLKKILLDARKALQWNGESGAIDKLRLKNPQAALVKLNQALDSLRASKAAGAPVDTLIALIEQVIASLQ